MKKKWLLSLLCLALSLTLLAGCNPKDPSSSDGSSSTAGTTAQTTGAEKTEPTKAPTEKPDATDPTTAPTEGTPPTTAPTDKPDTNPTTAPTTPSGDKGAAIAAKAKGLVGTTFEMGATGPDKFDNSGLVYYCMKENGITVPRMTRDMYKAGTAVEKADLKPGDAVFFSVDTEGAAQFVGIYIGDNQFVSSNNEDNPTRIYDMTYAYFSSRYVGARRF